MMHISLSLWQDSAQLFLLPALIAYAIKQNLSSHTNSTSLCRTQFFWHGVLFGSGICNEPFHLQHLINFYHDLYFNSATPFLYPPFHIYTENYLSHFY